MERFNRVNHSYKNELIGKVVLPQRTFTVIKSPRTGEMIFKRHNRLMSADLTR